MIADGITSIPVITIIVYALAEFMKHRKFFANKYIPDFCTLTGAIISLIAYFLNVPWLGANDILTAIAFGIASGLSAVGVNQIIKQTKKGE